MTLEEQSYIDLDRARELLFVSKNRNEKFDCLQTIISRCRSLKIDPIPYLKPPNEVKAITEDYIKNKCPYCDFTTEKGIQSLRAHVGMKHKNQRNG